ncbi:Ethanolamine-phosphate cytidylyltransferase [Coelomomyces lativittatus]|nr:Ethanolamine-phosphate cytidylyltransferase [Coelomomyces lativittatus]
MDSPIFASGKSLTQPITLPDGTVRKPVIVWVDGCFDMMHYGHANALRQAKQMGDLLVVGVHSDESILLHKGPTVMKEEERYEAVAACKWVDVVVPNAPYYTTLAMLNQYHCDFCVHGDDLTTLADGTDCYQEVKLAQRYKECKRTQGVSTTDLVGRMLLMTRTHPVTSSSSFTPHPSTPPLQITRHLQPSLENHVAVTVPQFLPTSRRILQFSEGREPLPGETVVYMAGDFDLFHIGHIEALKLAKQLGDFLLVGIYDDLTVNQLCGSQYPLMHLHERVLSVLSCRYVDEVVIGAPYRVTKELLEKVYKVHVVAICEKEEEKKPLSPAFMDPYQLPDALNLSVRLKPQRFSGFTTSDIVWRIIEQRKLYEERQRRKMQKEEQLIHSSSQSS